jgi:hypothetical protein
MGPPLRVCHPHATQRLQAEPMPERVCTFTPMYMRFEPWYLVTCLNELR